MEDPFAILRALSLQIAEDLLESSKNACTIKPHNIKNVLPAKTISLIVSKLAEDQGKYVKFKEVPFAFKAFNASPSFLQKRTVDAVLDKGINELNSLMEPICAPIGKDASPGEDAVAGEDVQTDNDIMLARLTAAVQSMITFYVHAEIDYLNDTFELKPKSAGGRKQKSRRGRKQKSRRGHKQKSRRGHKTRRHKRRSMRKH
jgi:hypothetical protein